MSGNLIKGCLLAALVMVCCLAILGVACLVSLFIPKSPVQAAGEMLNVELPAGTTVVSDNYEEPSFPTGDGYTWMVLQIPPEKIAEFKLSLQKSPNWKPLPLPSELARGERVLQPAFMSGIQAKIPISTATGCYFFVDHQAEYNKTNNKGTYNTSKSFYERYSFNFTFALFDEQDGKLYLWSLDT